MRSVTDKQLMVDSASPAALQAGVEAAIKDGGKVPHINSISGEQSRIDAVLPLVEKYKCPVVGLCLSDEGIPPTAEDRFAVAEMLHDKLAAAGLPAEDMWFDPLVMTVSADSTAALVTMETLALIKANLPACARPAASATSASGCPTARCSTAPSSPCAPASASTAPSSTCATSR